MDDLIELFRFAEGTKVFTQTSCPDDQEYNGETYDSRWPITRSQAESKNELARANVDITTSIDNPLAQRYLADPVDNVVTLSIFQKFDGVTNVFWKGRLSSVKASKVQVILSFESFFTSLRRPGLRARWQKSCRYALYGRGCNVNPENFRLETRIVSVSANVVHVTTVGGAPDNKYRGGMLRAPDGTARFITGQIGTEITLSRTFFALANTSGYGQNYGAFYGNSVVVLYPGCAHNLTDCKQTFNNLDNYGGFPWIPTRNPFGGSSIG